MSIISSKAEHVYKGNTLLQEAYIAGATRQPTDEEIEAGAKALVYAEVYSERPEEADPFTCEQVWGIQAKATQQWAGDLVNAIIQAMRRKATEGGR